MFLDDLIDRANARNKERFPRAPDSNTFSEMVKGWLVSGASVAAIFDSKGGFISVHDSENHAVAQARAYRNSGMPGLSVKRIRARGLDTKIPSSRV